MTQLMIKGYQKNTQISLTLVENCSFGAWAPNDLGVHREGYSILHEQY